MFYKLTVLSLVFFLGVQISPQNAYAESKATSKQDFVKVSLINIPSDIHIPRWDKKNKNLQTSKTQVQNASFLIPSKYAVYNAQNQLQLQTSLTRWHESNSDSDRYKSQTIKGVSYYPFKDKSGDLRYAPLDHILKNIDTYTKQETSIGYINADDEISYIAGYLDPNLDKNDYEKTIQKSQGDTEITDVSFSDSQGTDVAKAPEGKSPKKPEDNSVKAKRRIATRSNLASIPQPILVKNSNKTPNKERIKKALKEGRFDKKDAKEVLDTSVSGESSGWRSTKNVMSSKNLKTSNNTGTKKALINIYQTGRVNCSHNTGQASQCLVCNCLGEARGEPEFGQIAVNRVVLTRMIRSGFPNNACKVVWYQKRGVHAFSWAKNPKSNFSKNQVKKCAKAAFKSVQMGPWQWDHYYANRGPSGISSPYWEASMSGNGSRQIGNHKFLNSGSRALVRRASSRRATYVQKSIGGIQ